MPRLVGLRMSKTCLPYAPGSFYGVLLPNLNVRRELVALMVQLKWSRASLLWGLAVVIDYRLFNFQMGTLAHCEASVSPLALCDLAFYIDSSHRPRSNMKISNVVSGRSRRWLSQSCDGAKKPSLLGFGCSGHLPSAGLVWPRSDYFLLTNECLFQGAYNWSW